MGQTLTEIAEELQKSTKRVQLIYAFNGIGKTRLSRELKELIDPKDKRDEKSKIKFLYYNAYTEDLFYWDNDLDTDKNRKLMIRPNGFTELALNFLKDQGQDKNIGSNFQRYTNDKLTPNFNEQYTIKDKDGKEQTIRAYSEITFSIEGGNEQKVENIKISKGEESNLIWCIFYSLLEQIVETLNEDDLTNRATQDFNDLEYVFIDDPVSSLDDNHLIEVAVNSAEVVKTSTSNVHYIITTHNPLFYNVLFNEFENDVEKKYDRKRDSDKKRLEKLDDGTYALINSTDTPFSYHLFLLTEIEKAIKSGDIQKYHFNFMRNILEKTCTFLGYRKWKKLLPDGDRKEYYNRIINLYSHNKHHGEEIQPITEEAKTALKELVDILKTTYHFRQP